MFELALPWALAFIVLPGLIWLFITKAPLQLSRALGLPFYQSLVETLDAKSQAQILSTDKPAYLFLLIWSLLLLALAGPRWVGEPRPLKQAGRNLMLVLDLSESMGITDMPYHGRYVSRIDVVKSAAMQFVEKRPGDRIGLVLFGTRAYLQTPLTFDHSNVLLRLKEASVGLAGNSTSLGDALGLAIKKLQNVPKKSRVIVLLTDGANNSGMVSPLKAAELARDDGIKVYTIGLGNDEGLFNLGPQASLDEETLQKIAEMTSARYYRATDPPSLQTIYQSINQLETSTQKQALLRPQKELYAWPLGLALALLVLYLMSKSVPINAALKTRRRHAE